MGRAPLELSNSGASPRDFRYAVKNIAKPIRVYRVVADPDMIDQSAALSSSPTTAVLVTAPTLPDKPSIAVMPFVNLSGDPEQKYFSGGMTEDLITDLSKISGLFVISRNSVFSYKGTAVNAEQISKELSVRYILEGSVRKAVALDECQPTAHETLAYAWLGKRRHDEAIAEARTAINFDPNFADAYVSLGEILSFAGQPEEAVPLIEHAMRLNPRYTPNYLWALGHAHKLLGDYEKAIALFKRVLARNPDHLVAHLTLAVTYVEAGQREAQEVLRISPSYSVELAHTRTPYKDGAMVERQVEYLRAAGLA